MAAAPYILARNFTDAHVFARDVLGLDRGYYRVVTSPSSISGMRGADLHLVPGYQNRPDRFTLRSVLRWTRMNIVDHTQAKEPVDTSPDAVPGQQALPGTEAEDTGNGDNMVSEGGPATEVKQRRRRCRECGILVDPEDVEDHKKDHENDLLGSA